MASLLLQNCKFWGGAGCSFCSLFLQNNNNLMYSFPPDTTRTTTLEKRRRQNSSISISRQVEKQSWSSRGKRCVIVSLLCEIVLFLFKYVCNDRYLKRFLTWQTPEVLFMWTLSTFGCHILLKILKKEMSLIAQTHYKSFHQANCAEKTGNGHWGKKCNPKSFSWHNGT